MSFDNSYTAVTGATYQAADYNTYVKNNLNALWVGTTGGDMEYYTSATVKARLAKGTALQILRMNAGATAPEWAPAVNGLHAVAAADYNNAPYWQTSSTSYSDITNATVNITTTKTCTIVMFAHGSIAIQNINYRAYVQAVISGTGSGDGGAPFQALAGYFGPFSILYYRTGISAGTITCKLQGKSSTGGVEAYFERGRISVLAFES